MSGGQAFRIRVSGRVQGVGFRWFVRQAAGEVGGLTGRVRNLADGRVEVEVAGDGSRLEAFRERLRQGPPGARVTGLEEHEISPVPAWDGFDIDR
ncbi:MAG TPA: acylphosphatase [Thermoanaerobaculia bacterium]|jgi:acylphosphatase|nr:acylphosphatase [Thermoanaerobaculia bacterium]